LLLSAFADPVPQTDDIQPREVVTSSEATAATPAPPTDEDAEAEAREAQESDTHEDDAPIVPSRLHAPPIANAKSLSAAEDLLGHAQRDGAGHLVVPDANGQELLTIDVGLQDKLNKLLQSYQTPYGAVVALEPSTGRLLAMAEHSHARPSMRGLTTKAIFPAASVFKVVTASALLSEGLTPDTSACFHGGKRNVSAKMLEDSSRDRQCLSLQSALARSANGVFAKLTHRYLSADKLRAFARAYHFNAALDFPVPTDTSLAAVPEDTLGLAETGAGFGDVFMSPLHGALIASVVANGGVWKRPVLFEKDVALESTQPERVLPEVDAQKLAQMMAETVRSGTARRVFNQRGFAIKNAAGKTGSLADKSPFRDYSWFVGFAPREQPKVAVAAVIVNDYRWRIRAPFLAREAMRMYLDELSHRRVSVR
jgi:cell division protein FtsI/penicillin-binding protein 2